MWSTKLFLPLASYTRVHSRLVVGKGWKREKAIQQHLPKSLSLLCRSFSSSSDTDPPPFQLSPEVEIITTNTENLDPTSYSLSPDFDDENDLDNHELTNKRRLDVAIVGLPNAGKSQILNQLTQSTVSAVSRKRHTTREGILGARTIMDENNVTGTQLIFVDTPGFLRFDKAKTEGLERTLQVTARESMRQVDFTLIVVDAARSLKSEDYRATLMTLMMSAMTTRGREEFREVDDDDDDDVVAEEVHVDDRQDTGDAKFAIALNKVDLVNPKKKLLDSALDLSQMAMYCIYLSMKVEDDTFTEQRAMEIAKSPDAADEIFKEIDQEAIMKFMPTFFYTDARKGEGVDDILGVLLKKATPSHEWLVAAGESTNQTIGERIAEVIREKIYRVLHKELPYAVDQETKVLKKGINVEDGSTAMFLIHQDLIVYTKSHATIVRGKKNQNLERIRDSAIRDLQKVFGAKVTLNLEVKMKKSKNERRRR